MMKVTPPAARQGKERGGRGFHLYTTVPSFHDATNLDIYPAHPPPPHCPPGLIWGCDCVNGGRVSLPSRYFIVSKALRALYLPSSGLMACGFMGPVRMGLVVDTGVLSASGRSPPDWWFEADGSRGAFPPWSSREGLLTWGAFSCCCSEKNLWVDWRTSARCFAFKRENQSELNQPA